MSIALKLAYAGPEPEVEEAAPAAAEAPAAEAVEAPPAGPVDRRAEVAWNKLGHLLAALALPAATFAVVIGVWVILSSQVAPELPGPLATWEQAAAIFAEPFYDEGPNDMGIGWQLMYSLARVMGGFALAVAVGIPVGFLMGMSRTFERAWTPLIQILRPVSPLAWLPIGLLLFKAVNPSAVFVIFITSVWPVIVNTAAGVKAIPADYMNVARVLRLGKLEITRRILFPAALPHIITGMRLSLGIAWMVIVAAEMLTGGIGIGFYVWDEWNNLNVASIIVAIGVIGMVGIALESVMNAVHRHLDYNQR